MLNKVVCLAERLFGFQVFRSRPGVSYVQKEPGYSYVPDYFGRSIEKMPDIRELPVFGELAGKVIRDKRTYLYYDRLLTLFSALKSIRRMVKDDEVVRFAEVGVYRGGGTHFIASSAKQLGFTSFHLSSFDTFAGHASVDITEDKDEVKIHRKGLFGDVHLEDVEYYLRDFPEVSFHKGRFEDRCGDIADGKFWFVHLDVDIYAPTLHALHFFSNRLFVGGIIVVDDYGFRTCPGIVNAVSEFIEKNAAFTMLPLLSGQCLLIKHA